MKKVVFCLTVIVLFVATQALAENIVIKVNNVTVTFLRYSMKVKHEGGEDSISMPDITSIRFIKPTGRISITVYRGPTFHYDFGKDRAVRAKYIYTRMIGSVFKGYPRGERR